MRIKLGALAAAAVGLGALATSAHATPTAAEPGNAGVQTFQAVTLSPNDNVSVNVANGNLLYANNDGADLVQGGAAPITRYYNSQSSASDGLGTGWSFSSVPGDVHLSVTGSSIVGYLPGGAAVQFSPDPTTANLYSVPGTSITLARRSDGTYLLTDAFGEQLTFTSQGALSTIASSSTAPAWSLSSNVSGAPYYSTYTLQNGSQTDELYSENGQFYLFEDQAGDTQSYTVINNHLTRVTLPGTKGTVYAYNANGLLSSVAEPNGTTATFSYSGQQATEVAIINASGVLTGGYAYGYNTTPTGCIPGTAGSTTVTPLGSQGGTTKTYCYDADGFVNGEADLVPPGLATGFAADYSSGNSQTVVSWTDATDPPLADGTPGSGIASYNYRYELNGATSWSVWQSTVGPLFSIGGTSAGAVVAVQVQAVDGVGNVGSVASGTVTATSDSVTVASMAQGQPLAGETSEPIYPEPANLGSNAANGDAATGSETAQPFGSLSADYTETPCPNGSPCGTYNGVAAAAYALRWDLHQYPNGLLDAAPYAHHNFIYGYYGGAGGDCTNFVSQAMVAGGMRFERSNGLQSTNALPNGKDTSLEYLQGTGAFWSWYQDNPPYDLVYEPRTYDAANQFIRAAGSYQRLVNSNAGVAFGRVLPSTALLQRGDIIYYNLDGTSVDGINHAQIVSGFKNGHVLVSQHSPGFTQSFQETRNTIDANGTKTLGVDWDYWVVRPIDTAYNLTS